MEWGISHVQILLSRKTEHRYSHKQDEKGQLGNTQEVVTLELGPFPPRSGTEKTRQESFPEMTLLNKKYLLQF